VPAAGFHKQCFKPDKVLYINGIYKGIRDWIEPQSHQDTKFHEDIASGVYQANERGVLP
jgi:hypothetical protein